MDDQPAIRTDSLTKAFGDVKALRGITMEIQKGELFGLVGPDGAGKSTLMRLLTAVMEPTSGDAWVASHPIRHGSEKIKEKIAYMPQRFGLYEDLTVMENLVFYADIFDVHEDVRQHRMERLLGFSNLTPFTGRLAGQLSGGMKQKLGLACALIHTPEILFLDEPTNGVDPVSRRDFWKILYELLKEGVTIFVSTSYLDEAERCTHIGLIHEGRLLEKDTPSAIKAKHAGPMIELWCDNTRTAMEAAKKDGNVTSVGIYGDRLHMGLRDRGLAPVVIGALSEKSVIVKEYREITPSIEDIFLGMIGTASGNAGEGRPAS
ncbi:MAG TPA: ABC transporter ATP-binding protein [Syntrophorhabdaceae bacterium]|nr:ABC transporter ATP-binding protein [Syntrophorhabdaceae bacterium]